MQLVWVKSVSMQIPSEPSTGPDRRAHRQIPAAVGPRLLLDDMDLAWEDDELQKLNSHPNIEIRIFNLFANRDVGLP